MKRPQITEALLATTLLLSPVLGHGLNAAVKAAAHSTRTDIATLAQAIELNSYIWGNDSISPANYWVQARQAQEGHQ